MLSCKELEYLKNSKRRPDIASRIPYKYILQEILFSGTQAIGGAALAVYTSKNSTNRIWPIVYSVIAVGGTCNVFRSIFKIFWRSTCKKNESSARNVVTGTIAYFSSLYAFSEAWKCNDKLWIPCLGLAASGYCFAVSSLNNLKRFSTLKPLLKSCQLAFEPALIACGTVYLLYFRNHEEEYLYWLPLVVIGATGIKFVNRGVNRGDWADMLGESVKEPELLLLRAIEILMGGCLLTISSTFLVVYGSLKEFHLSWNAFMTLMSLCGVLNIFGSITCFQRYVNMDKRVSSCFDGMKTGLFIFFSACLMVKCIGGSMVYFMFLILAGGGQGIFWVSIYKLYQLIPRQLFDRYCQRALGPLLTVYSSVASAYVGYHMGWWFSLVPMTFVPAGIYTTYKGFKG